MTTKRILTERVMRLAGGCPDEQFYVLNARGLPFAAEKPDTQPRDAQGKFVSDAEAAYQSSDEKEGSFNQAYIVRHPESNGWEWDLKRLFSDAMGMRTVVSRDDLKRLVMSTGNIRAPKYYDKLFTMAVEQRVVQTTMDRSGRVVVIVP